MVALSASAPPSPLGPSVPMKLLESEPGGFSMFLWKNVTILTWVAPATGDFTARVAEATAEVASAYREGFSNVHLVKEGTGLPTAEARHNFAEMMNRHSKELACVGVALLGSGFWASALQGAITGIRMLNPRRSAILRIYDSIENIADWLPQEHLKNTGVTIHPLEVRAALTQAFLDTLRLAENGPHPVRTSA